MSEMEMFVGTFEEADPREIPDFVQDDSDERYDWEEDNECLLIVAHDKIFKVTKLMDLDYYGFSTTIPATERPIVLACWYNGGAGVHEVLTEAISEALDRQSLADMDTENLDGGELR